MAAACKCKKGYARRNDGKCVRILDCPSRKYVSNKTWNLPFENWVAIDRILSCQIENSIQSNDEYIKLSNADLLEMLAYVLLDSIAARKFLRKLSLVF
jgi:hypothetical protein